MPPRPLARLVICILAVILGLRLPEPPRPMPPARQRIGDEIVVAGRLYHTGTRVVLWFDPGGYDAYRTTVFFPSSRWRPASAPTSTRGATTSTRPAPPSPPPDGPRYGVRKEVLTDAELIGVVARGWTPQLLADKVDQFVIHYDATGLSRETFRVLHDQRNLSVHFMLDIDGTVYQTLDASERAWHAAGANGRSVGVEIANRGAYDPSEFKLLSEWYSRDKSGAITLTIPARFRDGGGVRTRNFVGRPATPARVRGQIHGKTLQMYDFTPQQYEALARLTAGLATALPKITPVAPTGPDGQVLSRALTPSEYAQFQGVLGHFHVTDNKFDPGPAFQWERMLSRARSLLDPATRGRIDAQRGRPVRERKP